MVLPSKEHLVERWKKSKFPVEPSDKRYCHQVIETGITMDFGGDHGSSILTTSHGRADLSVGWTTIDVDLGHQTWGLAFG